MLRIFVAVLPAGKILVVSWQNPHCQSLHCPLAYFRSTCLFFMRFSILRNTSCICSIITRIYLVRLTIALYFTLTKTHSDSHVYYPHPSSTAVLQNQATTKIPPQQTIPKFNLLHHSSNHTCRTQNMDPNRTTPKSETSNTRCKIDGTHYRSLAQSA